MTEQRKLTYEEWRREGRERFGDNPEQWRFVCPSCGHVASVADWEAVGASEGEVGFSCIGRHTEPDNGMCSGKQPCNYAGGGLFGLNPVLVVFPDGDERPTFEFAEHASDEVPT